MSGTASQRYLAYGTSITTELDLGEYLPAAGNARYCLELSERSASGPGLALDVRTPAFSGHGRQLSIRTDREFAESEAGQPWCFEVAEVVRFLWRGGEGGVEFEALDQCTDARLAFWVIHILLPLYFTLEGLYEFIHACAVETVGDTVLFTAPTRGGKSTLTDYFLKQGDRLVSDDKVATYCEDGAYFAVPSHPNHRPYRNFEDLGRRVTGFSPRTRPLDAVYALERADPEADVLIGKIDGHRKFARLLPSYLFNFAFLQEKRLRYLAAMINAVPVFEVDVPWDLDRLPEVRDAICGHREDGAS